MRVAFTPKGGCPLKPIRGGYTLAGKPDTVAFTPKGGCPLKRSRHDIHRQSCLQRSIHPQGWVPIETATLVGDGIPSASSGSIHPQGWVPIETSPKLRMYPRDILPVAFTPKGGCPLKLRSSSPKFRAVGDLRVAFTPKGGCPLKHAGPIGEVPPPKRA